MNITVLEKMCLLVCGLCYCVVSNLVPAYGVELKENIPSQPPLWVTEVMFEEREPGLAPYFSRMLVSKAFLRIDDGGNDSDFILFDRDKRQIFSVSHGEKTILRIVYREVSIDSPIPLKRHVEQNKDDSAPLISGKATEHIVLSINGLVCQNMIAVKGLLENVIQVLREYQRTLVGEQAKNLMKTPQELQAPCMLAKMIFAPTWHLEFGFPIREWDYRGFTRSLLNYQEKIQVNAELFSLPEDYRIYSIAEVQR